MHKHDRIRALCSAVLVPFLLTLLSLLLLPFPLSHGGLITQYAHSHIILRAELALYRPSITIYSYMHVRGCVRIFVS